MAARAGLAPATGAEIAAAVAAAVDARLAATTAALVAAPLVAALSGCGGPAGSGAAPAAGPILAAAEDADWDGEWRADAAGRTRAFYVSASSVERLGGSLESVTPAVRTPPGAGFYLSEVSCLGPFGPVSAYGPLGMLGPIGSNTWNPAAWMVPVGDWASWAKKTTAAGGALGEKGPLGPDGPLGDEAYYRWLSGIDDFGKQLQVGGVWTVLGPLGPLGALGPLGPLGPLGAHGFEQDRDGQYRERGVVRRAVTVPWNEGERTYELYENYAADFARQFEDNDTSFMTSEAIRSAGQSESFAFRSRQVQFVTVLVVPEKQLDDFDLEVLDEQGRALATSRSHSLIDFVQLPVPAGKRLTARVTLAGSRQVLSKTFRLLVTGSSRHFQRTDIRGDHQIPLRSHGGNP